LLTVLSDWSDRSLKPILRLLSCHETPEVQYWAVWALCNLTKVYSTFLPSLLRCAQELVTVDV